MFLLRGINQYLEAMWEWRRYWGTTFFPRRIYTFLGQLFSAGCCLLNNEIIQVFDWSTSKIWILTKIHPVVDRSKTWMISLLLLWALTLLITTIKCVLAKMSLKSRKECSWLLESRGWSLKAWLAFDPQCISKLSVYSIVPHHCNYWYILMQCRTFENLWLISVPRASPEQGCFCAWYVMVCH